MDARIDLAVDLNDEDERLGWSTLSEARAARVRGENRHLIGRALA
jgi:hypothetical protein